MDIWFLEAKVPVTKRIELLADGTIKKHPYPLISEFTSHKFSITKLEELEGLIQAAGARGWTLIKGKLTRELVDMSRMGTTVPEQSTGWICFDLDGLELGAHSFARDTDAFMASIGLPDVSYVVQRSASAGLPGAKGLRCHIFVLLNSEVPAPVLKDYLKHLNLELPQYNGQLSLTASHVALKWPLDITACQNDKLIYIAPPTLVGIQDPFLTARVEFVDKGTPTLAASRLPIIDSGKLKQKLVESVASLRKLAGLPEVSLKLKKQRNGRVEYQPGPAEARVTGEKRARGHVYLNLNGGDSWGYYYPENNPEYIHNFKGEPIYRTEELLPAYWAQLTDSSVVAPDSAGKIYLAFTDLAQDSRFRGLEYNQVSEELKFHEFGSKQLAREWAETKGKHVGKTLPFLSTLYDPALREIINLETEQINTYKASRPSKSKPRTVDFVAPLTKRIIDHVFSSEVALIEHFHNWVACIVQYGTITGTAWVWHGTQGTGKGLLYNLLREVLGPSNCAQIRMDALESQFTGILDAIQLVNVDEIQTSASIYEQGTIMQKIKQHITQDVVHIRRMFAEGKQKPNFANFLLTSNYHDPIHLASNDRRTNVCAYQNVPLVPYALTKEEARYYDREMPEAEHMYWYWKTRPADLKLASEPFANEAKHTLSLVSSSAIELASEALRRGDLEYFWDALPTGNTVAGTLTLTPKDLITHKYKQLIYELITTGRNVIARDELHMMMQYLVGDKISTSPLKFTQYARHNHIDIKPVWLNGRTIQGVKTTWTSNPVWLATAQAYIAANPIT